MKRLGRILTQLARYRAEWENLAETSLHTVSREGESLPGESRLTEIAAFGSNPGNLRMWTYAPQKAAPSPALVVVLHGCTQSAAGYDQGAGWSTLADRYGFVLLFPEQQKTNNPKLCFNWFQPGDVERGRGEVASIREMIEHAIRTHGIDRSQVFVTGLSAGGAMTAAMLATYPEVFAGGAIIAGLPYRCASTVAEAFECMFQGHSRPAQEWGELVRQASAHQGPWPRVSIWHGSADATVQPMNAGEIIKQWADVHGFTATPTREEIVDGYPRRVWVNKAGEEIIEEYSITGMAHGTPLATDGDNAAGAAGPFLLEAGISSSYHIARFWGLTEPARKSGSEEAPADLALAAVEPPARNELLENDASKIDQMARPGQEAKPRNAQSFDIGATITRALKAAGLMR